VTFAVAEDRFQPWPGRVCLLKRIISNNSYAHNPEEPKTGSRRAERSGVLGGGDNPEQENRGLDGVLYKL